MTTAPEERPEGFQRVAHALAQAGHAHAPLWLNVAARTSQEAADALGVQVGQIAKSVIFRRLSDDVAVLVVTSGDRRVDEKKVVAHTAPIGRADAAFVKDKTGFTIGGVAPLAHTCAPLTLIDRELFRFDDIWAAAGHPNGVFRLTPDELVALTGAPVCDVTPSFTTLIPSPCVSVCRMHEANGLCEGCLRTLAEITEWSAMNDAAKRAVWKRLPQRREQFQRHVQGAA
jgi:prolyl-tRNA editing enzyme YbaK/EbsC (Cys-tRNA(Pro) deacylase)/predicted Fe-S protein YdhL (DUF1289 family)